MENYSKGKNVEEPFDRDKIPIENLPANFLWMHVKGGSKMYNLLSHASEELKSGTSTAVLWSGAGAAISKTISCAEVIKRDLSMDHQITRITVKTVEEYWEPKIDGLETIVVKREIPVIHILLSYFKINCALGMMCVGQLSRIILEGPNFGSGAADGLSYVISMLLGLFIYTVCYQSSQSWKFWKKNLEEKTPPPKKIKGRYNSSANMNIYAGNKYN